MAQFKFIPRSPQDFAFSHPETLQNLQDILAGVSEMPNSDQCGLLFHGPTGTGKTALAAAFPGFMENSPNVLDTGYGSGIGFSGVEFIPCYPSLAYSEMFNRIRKGYDYSSRKGRRYIILDEVDTLPSNAEAGLKSLMGIGGPPETVFLLTTNDRSKLSAALRGRCIDLPMYYPPVQELVRVGQAAIVARGLPVSAIPVLQLQQFAATANQNIRPYMTAIANACSRIKRTQANPPNLIQLPVATPPRVQP